MHACTTDRVETGKRQWEPALLPPADVQEMGDHFLVVLELPGVRPEDVNLEVEGDDLRLTAKRSAPKDESGYLLRERSEGTYCRIFRLGEIVDRERITGKLTDGVLTIQVPKSPRVLPRKVAIS